MKGNKIIELQVGFHVDKLRRYQRIITNEYFDEYLFEHQDYNDGKYNISYSKDKPNIHDETVSQICDNISIILENAKLNYESDSMFATIRFNDVTGEWELKYANEMDIWKDVKVWITGVYPKYQGNTLFYTKHSYHSKYLRDGVNEEKLNTDTFYHKGDEISFSIETSNISNRYTAIISVYNSYEWEATDAIHGRYHGYYYFDNFREVQEFFRERYGKELVQRGNIVKHHYS